MHLPKTPGPIGIFDSGYGGLTIYGKIKEILPQYDFIYLGDNARSPYGSRSFDVVYEFTRQAVLRLFVEGCRLVILACNTASAKALRTIQQKDLPGWDPERRVLGIIRPTVESVDRLTQTKHIGILGTEGTVSSGSYTIEIHKLFPEISVASQACPMWVPIIENNEYSGGGADYFVKKYLDKILKEDALIDLLILGCTHYPLLINKIKEYIPERVKLLFQGEYVAESLADYLKRHPEMDEKCTKNSNTRFYTSESPDKFAEMTSIFLKEQVKAEHINMDIYNF
ncbi:MAG: glutamate racemase [Candidatus Azobacteroides sp.]|nr:glutamate racemase [Candidatus Azobacteroides sp.]